MNEKDWYQSLGVSAHKAFLKGVPAAQSAYFAAVGPDIAGDSAYRFALHADGVGTKGILAYLWWKETGDATVWQALAQDALVMNTDDLACSGITDGFVFSTTITRNPFHIPDEVVLRVIQGVYAFAERLRSWGIHAEVAGGETADMPDVVRTIGVEAVAAARVPAEALIPLRRPDRQVWIVGLASAGQATYETEYNSGVGCNGITALRHLLLSPEYARRYPETVAPELTQPYQGPYTLHTPVEGYPLGWLLTRPTRTYLPVLRAIYATYRSHIYAVVHCTGGGQRKALKCLPHTFIRKDNFFPLPPVFALMAGWRPWKDLFETLNMGHRMELYLAPEVADEVIALAQAQGVPAQVIGIARPHEGPTCIEVSFQGEHWTWQEVA